MDRKRRGTVAVFIIAAAIVVAGVVNRYFVSDEADRSIQGTNVDSIIDEDDIDTESASPTGAQGVDAETTGQSTSEPENTTTTDLTGFKVIVNEVQKLDILVRVDLVDGLTREEAEQIAEATFVQVKGEEVMRRLDSLTLDENSIEAHYTWGLDESDMGHFFDITVDIASRLITVAHCF